MIRLLVSLGRWLDARFPAKVIVTETSYLTLKAQVDVLVDLAQRNDYQDLVKRINTCESGINIVQTNAVHKEAVQDVIAEMVKIKADLQSFKVSLGFNRIVNKDLSAMLNGEVINE